MLWFAAPILSSVVFHMPALAYLLRIFAVSLPVYAAGNVLVATLTGMNRVATAAVLDRAGRSTLVLIFTGALLALGLSLPALAYRDLSVGAIIVAVAWWIIARLPWGSALRQTSGPVFGSLLEFSLPLLVAEFVNLIMLRTDIIMLATLRTGAEVGIFGAVTRIAWVTVIPLVAIDASTFPAFAEHFGRGQLKDVQALYALSVRWALLTSTVVAVVAWVFARDILDLFGAEFREGAWALRLVVSGFWLRAALGSVSGIMTMGGRSRIILYNNLGALGLNVVLNYVLVRRWGIAGAGIATGAITAVSGLVMLVEGTRLFGVSYEWRQLGRALIVACSSIGLGLLAQVGFRGTPLLIRCLATGSIVVVLMAGGWQVLGLWHAEDRALLSNLWRRAMGEPA